MTIAAVGAGSDARAGAGRGTPYAALAGPGPRMGTGAARGVATLLTVSSDSGTGPQGGIWAGPWAVSGMPGGRHVLDRLGPVFAGVWLFFLGYPVHEAWVRRDEPAGLIGLLATVIFAGVYMTLWIRISFDRMRIVNGPPRREALAHLGALGVLAAVMIACLGTWGVGSLVYIAVNAAMVLPMRIIPPVVAGLVGVSLVPGPHNDWADAAGMVFAIVVSAVAITGMRAQMRANYLLARMEQDSAVEAERSRLARDLHDILGHSLTVIAVKAELAGKLLYADPARAGAELADLERLSRDALADVRRTVDDVREMTLPGELARARVALAAAGIEARLHGSVGQVPAGLRELFAWAVREGVTNVIRHSGARTCVVTLSATAAEIRDDGAGAYGGSAPGGSGLAGLRYRAAAVGARVVVDDLGPGFSLRVVRP